MRAQHSSGAFALCVEDGGTEDLEVRKIYQLLPDPAAKREGYVRVIDESGEDYIYPSSLFVSVRLSASVVRRLRRSTRATSTRKRSPIRRTG
jgi:hypothetical protein